MAAGSKLVDYRARASKNISDFAKGAYNTTFGLVLDIVDGAITLGYSLDSRSEEVKSHFRNIPLTKAGISGAVFGGIAVCTGLAGIVYNSLDVLTG